MDILDKKISVRMSVMISVPNVSLSHGTRGRRAVNCKSPSHRGMDFMFQALGHLALKLLQDAIHYICVLSPLGARSLLCASGDIGSSTD